MLVAMMIRGDTVQQKNNTQTKHGMEKANYIIIDFEKAIKDLGQCPHGP